MNKTDRTNYMSEVMRDRLTSPAYNVAIYRNPETEVKENILQEFLDHVEEEFDMSSDEMSDLQALVNDFLGYDIKKVETGEREMLARWIQNVKGE